MPLPAMNGVLASEFKYAGFEGAFLVPDKQKSFATMLCHSQQTQGKHHTFTVAEAEVSTE